MTALVAVYTPPHVTIQGDLAGLAPTTMAGIEMARADWLARAIGDLVAKLDRSSGREHEKLVSLLIDHEMALRSAERSSQRLEPASTKTEKIGAERNSEKVQAARAAGVETTRRAGLEADLASVRSYLGETPSDLTRPLVGVPEATAPDRIRFFGRPFALIGSVPGIDEPSSSTSLILERRPWEERGNRPPIPAIVTLLLLAGVALVTTGARRRLWINSLALLMALGLAGYLGGPMILTGGLGLAAAGWTKAHG